MCGICGWFNYSDSKMRSAEDTIVAMRDSMTHRGPDDAGLFISPEYKVALAHRRLSIVDLKTGHQPMCNEDGSVWIVYNGEIYNHAEIRQRLENKGHIYKTNSDTESIIHLYEEIGDDCVNYLRGMFAFAIWDSRKNRALLARDKVGIKPLYYTQKNGQLIFASEIKALLKHPEVTKELDYEALYHYLTFAVTPAPMTLFRGIRKLSPGCRLLYSANDGIRLERYWDPACFERGRDTYPEQYYIEKIRELLRKSIKYRMMSDVPFGVFLSGGVDSSLNVALMSELMNRPVDTFSVGIKDDTRHNEFEHARAVAKYFNTNHHETLIGEEDFLRFLPDMPYYQDEPLADPVCVPLYYLAKLTRASGTIVIQVGEGSDELFCGYKNYARVLEFHNSCWRPYTRMPSFAKIAANGIARTFLNEEKRDYLKRATYGEELFWGGAIAFWESQKRQILNGKRKPYVATLDSHDIVKGHYSRLSNPSGARSFLDKMIYLELKMRLPELLLMRVDKMTMANSVEARVPYLDEEMVRFAMAIPAHLKYRNGQTKYILKKAAEGLIPGFVIKREKMGFCGSARNMLTPKLQDFASGLLSSSDFINDLFDREYISGLFEMHIHSGTDNSFRIWNLLNLALWHKYWFK